MHANTIIDALGGVTAVARKTGVKPPSVHEWRGTDRIPRDKLVLIAVEVERCTPLRRWDLLPADWHRIWPELIGADGAPMVPSEVRDAA